MAGSEEDRGVEASEGGRRHLAPTAAEARVMSPEAVVEQGPGGGPPAAAVGEVVAWVSVAEDAEGNMQVRSNMAPLEGELLLARALRFVERDQMAGAVSAAVAQAVLGLLSGKTRPLIHRPGG